MKFFKNRAKQATRLSIQEAYHLWGLTRRRYSNISIVNHYINLIHDQDFQLVLDALLLDFKGELKMLENLMDQYAIKGPQPNPRDRDTGDSSIVNDEEFAKMVFEFAQSALKQELETITDSIFNDELRELFILLAEDAIKNYSKIIEFLKAKDWIDIPPLYQTIKPDVNEQIAINEVYHLWEHLNYRYIHIHHTKIYIKFVKNVDLQNILQQGVNILNRQVTKLENELLYFGINLPQEYSRSLPAPRTIELYDDQFIFQHILIQMQTAVSIHGTSIQELILNDRIRDLFTTILFEEISLVDKMIKYGKTKGWLPLVPIYNTAVSVST